MFDLNGEISSPVLTFSLSRNTRETGSRDNFLRMLPVNQSERIRAQAVDY